MESNNKNNNDESSSSLLVMEASNQQHQAASSIVMGENNDDDEEISNTQQPASSTSSFMDPTTTATTSVKENNEVSAATESTNDNNNDNVINNNDVLQPQPPPLPQQQQPPATPTTTTSSTISTAGTSTISTTATSTTMNSSSFPMTSSSSGSRLRVYKAAGNKWVTREIAALDFLLGIPMQAERNIVHQGWMQQRGITIDHRNYNTKDDEDDNEYFDGPGGGDDGYKTKKHRGEEQHDDEAKSEIAEATVAPIVAPSASTASNSTNNNTGGGGGGGRWWEKWINARSQVSQHHILEEGPDADNEFLDTAELEQPNESERHQQRQTSLYDIDELRQSSAKSIFGQQTKQSQQQQQQQQQVVPSLQAPGRRLQGDEAINIQIPLTIDTKTRQRSIAKMAAIREWEIRVAHGLSRPTTNSSATSTKGNGAGSNNSKHGKIPIQLVVTKNPPLLDGRLFFSAAGSYPVGVFSMLRYEPKKEEAARLRQKLEARGGGGTQFFVMPERDWRGISYRALLPQQHVQQPKTQKRFNRFLRRSSNPREKVLKTNKNIIAKSNINHSQSDSSHQYQHYNSGSINMNSSSNMTDKSIDDHHHHHGDHNHHHHHGDDSSSTCSSDSDDSENTYVPGVLDDPTMVQGRHRNVMIGDRVTGCIVSSTIQFVKPSILKADLNKQFRERFDGWEPPKSAHKFIGARVIDGIYTLVEPDQQQDQQQQQHDHHSHRSKDGSVSSRSVEGGATGGDGTAPKAAIRMPPSLTLSKIRSVKHQALMAAVKYKLEIATVALACVYFERLCLECRVDKTNRRLTFAACLLLSSKINEANVALVLMKPNDSDDHNNNNKKSNNNNKLQSLIRPTKKSSNMFASLLEFFTQEWCLSLKHLFAAEWGVFAALRFKLHTTPSQVAFHFKRMMKTLEWNPHVYLGREMYDLWQESLVNEELNRAEKMARRERKTQRKAAKLLELQRELQYQVAVHDEEVPSDVNNNSSNNDNNKNTGGSAEITSSSQEIIQQHDQQKPQEKQPQQQSPQQQQKSATPTQQQQQHHLHLPSHSRSFLQAPAKLLHRFSNVKRTTTGNDRLSLHGGTTTTTTTNNNNSTSSGTFTTTAVGGTNISSSSSAAAAATLAANNNSLSSSSGIVHSPSMPALTQGRSPDIAIDLSSTSNRQLYRRSVSMEGLGDEEEGIVI